jgi:hypothetical protein
MTPLRRKRALSDFEVITDERGTTLKRVTAPAGDA